MKLTENQIVDFKFDEHTIQASIIDGEPVFIAKDVCQALGIKNHERVVSRLAPGKKAPPLVRGGNAGPRQMATINEKGLYALIFMSRKPAAERFRDWIGDEVLPAIRKTGFYAMGMDSAVGKARLEVYRARKRLSFLEAMADLDREPVPGVEYLSVPEYFARLGVTPIPDIARRFARLAVVVSRQQARPYVCLYRTVHSGPTKMFPVGVLDECSGLLPAPQQKLLPLAAGSATVIVTGAAAVALNTDKTS